MQAIHFLMMYRQAATQMQENSALCANLLLSQNHTARPIVIPSHKKRPTCGWPFLGCRVCARRIRGLRLLEQGQHALLRLVGLGQHGGGGLGDDLRLGQVVIIPNFGCHPRLNPRSMQHEPLYGPAVVGRVEKKSPASRRLFI